MKSTKPTLTLAIKTHTCTDCGKPIEKGQRYMRWIEFTDKVTVQKLHADCESARRLEAELANVR